jgi:fibronectin type 3 domain-containing protein
MKKSGRYLLLGISAVGVFALLLLLLVGLFLDSKDVPHSVTLTWQAPTPRSGVAVVGYNIYRRTVEGSSFIKIADRVAQPLYEDRLVTSGRKYIYAVTSVDSSGRESRFSREAEAQIP